jgi:hypothetical protein
MPSRLIKRIRKVKVDRHRVHQEFLSFRDEFKKYFLTFITGALAFVAALVWRDAISNLILRVKASSLIQHLVPPGREFFLDFYTAIGVTIVAVVGIILISKLFKVKPGMA